MHHGQSRGKVKKPKKNENREEFINFAEIVGNMHGGMDAPVFCVMFIPHVFCNNLIVDLYPPPVL